MSLSTRTRPTLDEYDSYYGGYVERVPDEDVLHVLERGATSTRELLAGVPAEKEGFRYASGKWSLREVIGHVIDVERVFAYRALRFARADTTELPGMEQDDLVAGGNFESRSLHDLSKELRLVRESNLVLFRSFDDEILSRRGRASGCGFTVRSILYILAGHEIHHVDVIRERYLSV